MYISSKTSLTDKEEIVKLVRKAIREIVAISDRLLLDSKRAHDVVSQENGSLVLGRGGSASVGHSAGGQRLGTATSSTLEEE